MFTGIHIKFIDNTPNFGLIRKKRKYNYKGIKNDVPYKPDKFGGENLLL